MSVIELHKPASDQSKCPRETGGIEIRHACALSTDSLTSLSLSLDTTFSAPLQTEPDEIWQPGPRARRRDAYELPDVAGSRHRGMGGGAAMPATAVKRHVARPQPEGETPRCRRRPQGRLAGRAALL